VEKIVTTQEEAEKEGVKNPPKVLFTDQRGKDVAHNPGTLDKVS
jgi:thioredoxin-related protein